jgi:transposase
VVPYEAPQGRRVNRVPSGRGAFFTHGPLAGEFYFDVWACLPKREREGKDPEKRPVRPEVLQRHGLREEEVGVLDSARLLSFLWRVGGRPEEAPEGWVRSRPLLVALDNYSVHKSEEVKAALPALQAAGIHLLYLPAYSPELSRIEPVWQDVKYREMRERSFSQLGALIQQVRAALARKAAKLRHAFAKPANLLPRST